ncbi:MAG: response regulator [Verrucomicrobiae bacterium]|nr:response regulator [Verrucomicrobiae bacterium]
MRILLVEDNPAEARLTKEALGETGVRHELCLVEDGEKATAFLKKEGGYFEAFRPDLIFLDLNLPRKDGRQVLREVKGDPSLASIPVIVISNSRAPEDIEHVYQLRANCYLVKPPGLEDFFTMMRRVVDFWWLTARLPNEADIIGFPVVPNEFIA